MNMLLQPVRSSLGSKYAMAITGVLLIGFVLAHMAGNLLIFLGTDALNAYAKHLEDFGMLLWVARLSLLLIFATHIALGLRLSYWKKYARPIPYQYEDTVQASWASRHMLLTGLVIFAFVIYHLLHFSFGLTDPDNFKGSHSYRLEEYSRPVHDVAFMVIHGFQQPIVALSYILAQVFLFLHLWHGGGSWFQSLGWNTKASNKITSAIGPIIATVVLIGNCSIPLAILTKVIVYTPALAH